MKNLGVKIAAGVVASAVLVLPLLAAAEVEDEIITAGLPYMCVNSAGCATLMSTTPIVKVYSIPPTQVP